jgi:hypothetical protein
VQKVCLISLTRSGQKVFPTGQKVAYLCKTLGRVEVCRDWKRSVKVVSLCTKTERSKKWEVVVGWLSRWVSGGCRGGCRVVVEVGVGCRLRKLLLVVVFEVVVGCRLRSCCGLLSSKWLLVVVFEVGGGCGSGGGVQTGCAC